MLPFRLCILTCILLLCTIISTGQPIHRFDIVIDELLPDPAPVVQLPNSEFIELKNTSSIPINLRNCTLSDGSTTATITANYTLLPDSFVIICPNSAIAAFSIWGSTLGVSNFPSLHNDADIISLYAPDGTLIHAVAYNNTWYQNAVKSEGGWSLEMIDTRNPCAGSSNWKASQHNSGGTPGQKNSIDAINPDEQPPVLLRTYTVDSITIAAVFDEPVDSTSAANMLNYTLDNSIGHPVQSIPSLTEVVLKLVAPLKPETTYQLSVKNVSDCAGNTIGQLNTAKAGLPVIADSFHIIINELLFNPPPDGFDYIELYNRSRSVVDLKQLYLANRNITGQLTNITALTTIPYLLFPGEYKVFTEHKAWVQQRYLIKDPSVIVQCNTLPSMPDDKGDIVLVNQQGIILDELRYDEKWHFALIDNKDGVALERINYNYITQDRYNWSSAASAVGFGTPGYPNSQLYADASVPGQVAVLPSIFSPDNDGRDDFATIQLDLPEPGYVANISIFDAQGYLARHLVQQATLTLNNQFRWDGLNDKSTRLPVGIYVVLTELFRLNGKSKKYKSTLTLVRR